jgi:putative redox protein
MAALNASTKRTAEMVAMIVRSLGGDRYAVQVRGHELIIDQPTNVGGTDLGPTPVELFVASLASCVAHYAGRFLARHHICRDGLRVDTSWQMSQNRPARVASVTLRITPPPAMPPERLPALLAVARACTIHNTLEQAPDVSILVTAATITAPV